MWPNLQQMQVMPSGEQNWNQCQLNYMLVKFGTNADGANWWSNFELLQVEWNQMKFCQIWNQRKLQVAFYLAVEITQVKDSTPWVRCASGNVY